MNYLPHIREEFGKYVLRTVEEEQDRPLVTAWVNADRYHAGVIEPDFFLGKDPRSSYYALEDHNGVIFFIRLARAARVFMQFSPGPDLEARRRIGDALIQGMAFLEAALGRAGCEQWVFDTRAPGLRYLTMHRLGFRTAQDDLTRPIEPPGDQKPQEGASAGREEGV